MSLNKVILIGNLGKDPEAFDKGDAKICKFPLATSRKVNGEKYTEWHNVVTFGKLSEIAAQYLNKGSQVCIEGRIQTRMWETKEGEKRYSTEIVAEQMTMLGGSKEPKEKAMKTTMAKEETNDLPW